MVCLQIIRFPKIFVPIAFISMAIHRLPLSLNKHISFWKLMGSGKGGTFSKEPDWQQWSILTVWENEIALKNYLNSGFIFKFNKWFANEQLILHLQPIAGHGLWDGGNPFKINEKETKSKTYHGPIGIITRASIRLNKAKDFWNAVPDVEKLMNISPGYIFSVGVGEIPYFRQATFSIWDSLESAKNFAYQSREHREVIDRTRKEDWYSEELFMRFNLIDISGTLHGKKPAIIISKQKD